MPVVVYSDDPGTYRRIWAPFVLWGLGLIAFGLVVLVAAELTGKAFVMLFGVLALIAGVTQLASAVIAHRKLEGLAWLPVAAGTIACGIGLFTLVFPDTVARGFALVIGAAAFAWGVSDIAIGWTGREYFPTWRLHVARGIISAGAGIFLMARPIEALLAATSLVGAWAIVIGLLTLWLGLNARSTH